MADKSEKKTFRLYQVFMYDFLKRNGPMLQIVYY